MAIARAIASNPLFLLADEPTGNLDTKRSIEIMEILARLNADSKITILMVTHEPEIARYATREIMFLDGLVQSDSANTQPQSIRDAAPPIGRSKISQNGESNSVQAQYN